MRAAVRRVGPVGVSLRKGDGGTVLTNTVWFAVAVAMVVALGGTPGHAQSEEEPDPCAHIYGQIALTTCWAREAERADEEMKRTYLALLQKLPEPGSKSLEKAQKLWLEFREAHLGTLYGVDDPKAVFGRDYQLCTLISKVALTRGRTRELARLLEPDEETICPL